MKKTKLALILTFLLIVSAVTTYIVAGIITNKDKKTELFTGEVEEMENELSEEDKWRSPLSGRATTEEIFNRRPVAVMFDNHPNARWQSGLNQAEIVYEFPVENPYTRYIGIFLANSPESIGPVRSTRPYLVHTIAAYDPLYVRCGGSEEGKKEVKRYDIADIDGLESNAFKRSSKKRAPNNLYISMEDIMKEQKRLNYGDYANYEGYKFNLKDTDISGIDASNVKIVYNNESTTGYEYDSEDKMYKRYKDGSLHIDELDDSTIVAKNIIIQKVNSKIIDSVGRKEIDIIGSGKGMYITNGKVKDISWEKSSVRQRIVYFDENGEINLNEGVTWIQIVPQEGNVVIE